MIQYIVLLLSVHMEQGGFSVPFILQSEATYTVLALLYTKERWILHLIVGGVEYKVKLTGGQLLVFEAGSVWVDGRTVLPPLTNP